MERDWELWFAYMDGAPEVTDEWEVIKIDVPVDLLPVLSMAAETAGVRTSEFIELSVLEAIQDGNYR